MSYFIDPEMLDGKDHDLVVYKKSVRIKDGAEMISNSIKNEVLSSLLDYLKDKERLRVDLA